MRQRNLIVSSLLLIIALASFWPVGRLGFILLDDSDYIYNNPQVQTGFSLDHVRWAFTAAHSSNWHPLTWMSHMLDCQWFGLNPSGHHWVNLGFHTANALLLFLLLQAMTGARWRSFLVAALFACHPMHVESVAWISERKDVLSGFFALLTLLAYCHYCRQKSTGRYLVMLVLFALGLMTKPMLVTLPAVMLILDFWPLNRWQTQASSPSNSDLAQFLKTGRALLIEKIPFFLLSLTSCVITIWAQRTGNSVISLNQIPWGDRLLHATVSYAIYLEKMFWPKSLAIFYPYTPTEPGELICQILLLVLVSVICIRLRRTRPYLLAGWAWFVITLLPVIGLMQVGMQSMADRYVYLPSIGLFIGVVWGLAGLANRSNLWRAGVVGGAATLIVICILDTRHQLHHWRNNITLFTHAVEVTPQNNFVGYFFLGNAYGEAGDLESAANSFSSALAIAPGFKEGRIKLGYALLLQKKYPEAETQFRELLRVFPQNPYAHESLGHALAGQGQYDEAQTEYQTSVQSNPNDARLGKFVALNRQKLMASTALANLREMIATNATAEVHIQTATMLAILGNYRAAVEHYNQALVLKPDAPDALNNLAWLLATCPEAGIRDGARAVQLAQKACEITQYKETVFIGTLGAAYARDGRFDDAVATAQRACAIAGQAGETGLLKSNQELMKLYREHKSYSETTEKLVPIAP